MGSGCPCRYALFPYTTLFRSLAPGAAPAITIVVTAPSEGGTITNTATVSSSTNDANTGNNTATETTTVTASAELSITKSDSPDPVTAGGTLTYTLSVSNEGLYTPGSFCLND